MNYLSAKDEPKILDAAFGSKMFWYDRDNEHTLYVDNRCFTDTLCDARKLVVNPDFIADFTALPIDSNTFNLVVFDPPHMLKLGKNSWMAKKYGVLPEDWQTYLQAGFAECFRVLKPFGVLMFKWSSDQIPHAQVLKLTPELPLFGDRRGKTRWTIFVKGARENG